MPTTFIKGDLFEDSKGPDVYGLAFAADCSGSTGQGIAVAFSKQWPAFAAAFRAHAAGGKMQPGDLFAWRDDNKDAEHKVIVYALGISAGDAKPKLASLVRAVETMIAKATTDGLSRIAMARIGSGLDVQRVKRVLTDIGAATTINIAVFEQFIRARAGATEPTADESEDEGGAEEEASAD